MFSRLLLIACVAFFAASSSDALTLDWNSFGWANGATSGTSGNITATVNATGGLTSDALITGNPPTPAVTSYFGGGSTTAQTALTLACDFANTSQTVTVTIDFSAAYPLGVQNVTFNLFDIDFSTANGSNFQDKITSISGMTPGNSTVYATLTGSTANQVSGSGTATATVVGIATANDTGTTSSAGNVTIDFGTTAVSRVTFTYTSGTGITGGAGANPTFQHIGISNVSFTPVPEVNPAWFGAISCLAVGFIIRKHNARFRK